MKKLLKATILTAGLLLVCCVETLLASHILALSSASQEKRDAAAKILRETYTPPSRTNWNSLLTTLKVGTPKTNVLEQLRSFNLHSEGGAGSGNTETELYRLDDLWVLECSFTNSTSGSGLARRDLTERLRYIWVEPPPSFTGTWTTYYANGQRSHEIHYKDGSYDKEFISFHSNGSKAVTQHYLQGKANGEDVGFYPSGKLNYKGQYNSDAQVGIWIWYNEDGSIKSRRDYSKP